VTGLSRGPLHRCTRPVLRCAAPRVPSSAVPVSFCGPHLCRSTEVAPVRSPLSKKKQIQQSIPKKQKEQKKRQGRGTIGSTTSVSTRLGLAACLFPPLSLFFLSLSLSALVISSVCDGLSTLI
jgi:hypothetical protein